MSNKNMDAGEHAKLEHELLITADMDCFCGSNNCEVCAECDYENHD